MAFKTPDFRGLFFCLCSRYFTDGVTCPLRGTTLNRARLNCEVLFQSTCPLRGTTDQHRGLAAAHCSDFNPRAPCGARHGRSAWRAPSRLYFNPRAPCGARREYNTWTEEIQISIHVPLAGHDPDGGRIRQERQDFNPRAPCGARPTGAAGL